MNQVAENPDVLPSSPSELDKYIAAGEYTKISRVAVMEDFLLRAARRLHSLRAELESAEREEQPETAEAQRVLSFLYDQFAFPSSDLRMFFRETGDFWDQTSAERMRLFAVAEALVGSSRDDAKIAKAESLSTRKSEFTGDSPHATPSQHLFNVVGSARALLVACQDDKKLALERTALARDIEAISLVLDVSGDRSANNMDAELTLEDWQQVLKHGLEMGNYWRPELVLHDVGDFDDDGLYYDDWNNRDEQSRGPFATLDDALADALRDNCVDEWRLVTVCGLSAAKARKVMEVAEKLNRCEKAVDESPEP